jgi:hypothetical protein
MKKVKMFFNCMGGQIKKYFFKGQNNDINHACEKLKDLTGEATSIEELKLTEEYMIKYNTTTRWQTL